MQGDEQAKLIEIIFQMTKEKQELQNQLNCSNQQIEGLKKGLNQ